MRFPLEILGALSGSSESFYPQAEPATHVLEAALYNGNPLSHPLPCLLNAGRIEHAGDSFHLYQQGITPAVARAMAALDEERLAVCRALGLLELPVGERLERLGYIDEVSATAPADVEARGPVPNVSAEARTVTIWGRGLPWIRRAGLLSGPVRSAR